jgi:outer membrane protein OmpA-like peptidoglycan-associated protein
MKLSSSSFKCRAQAALAVLLAAVAFATVSYAQTFTSGEKGSVKGDIKSRNGDLVNLQDSKTGSMAVVKITDDTKVLRDKSTFGFPRHQDMNITAMVPGLTISAEGVGNAAGQLEATKITFSPDVFAVEVAEQQEINANKSAAGQAQSTANRGVAAAAKAQSAANQAQNSANQASTMAAAAGVVAVTNAADVNLVNQRVSDLDDYKTVAQAAIFYPTGQSTLNDAAKADLDKLAALASSTAGYMIEVAGYASKTGGQAANQQLSEDRAAAVADYLREHDNIPMRRILAPAGFGSTHPLAENTDPQGRALDRRVDVTLLVNKGLQGGM